MLQNYWDSKLKHKQLLIILVGSSIGMMQKITSSKAGALYGRVTKIKVSPFNYHDFREMFKELSEEEKIFIKILEKPCPRDELIRQSKLDTGNASATLSLLEIKGLITEELGEVRKTF